ncbi:DUF3142 domain-containing protein [Luteibacter aegosomatissinici]|uniref:DUF3142 domain-containing protein n=1 Tax=Luteibacter aegosomatissinici TaxID=2911539 RepID=UPI001FF98FC2|nr:DUF3142 domain-containing protein [Luteibacter aegosomatissinici]UPG95766.1 DUF3142 domain-containing protein [Luteibacter aegosomatissinici]
MAPIVRFSALAFAIALLIACGRAPAPLTHDAYIWQRQWTPSLRSAVDASHDVVRDWRVLVAQASRDGRFQVFAPDRESLAASGRPLILVVRIDGRLATFDAAALRERIARIAADWPQAAGVEIDYDCPTARLPAYAAFLRDLKPALGKTPLSITALPTWIGSSELDAVLAIPDESVLQVHAVQAPQAGLFNADVAANWVSNYARHTHKPFRVALPTYGSRVSWNEDGTLLAVESEQAALAAGAVSSELYASADTVLAFVQHLSADRPRGLAGIVWFRLPTTDDTRAWSLATWRGVVTNQLDRAPLRLHLRDAGNGASDVLLENPAAADAAAPARVALPAGCELADGIDGYRLEPNSTTPILVAALARPLRAHTTRAIGWARCRPGTFTTLTLQGTQVS